MIRLSRSVTGAEEQAAASRAVQVGYMGTGPETAAFESELAAWFGSGISVACVNTGTAAIHLALQAVGVGPGDEVLVPTLTFVATFQAVTACGATPVACDVDERTGQIDLEDAARRVTARTRVLLPVHYASYVGNIGAQYEFARQHKLRVVEDAAHAFGCEYEGRKVGSFGDVACFSFDGIKNITSGEGGAVLSADAEVMRKVRDARLLGVENDSEQRYKGKRSWEFDVSEQGWRYHMSDVMAAIGRVQLKRFDGEFKPARVRLAQRYRDLLSDVQGVRLFDHDVGSVVPHIFPVRVPGGRRDTLRQALLDAEIECGIHYRPGHLLSRYGGGRVKLPVAERLYAELLSLPLHAALSDSEQDSVVATVKGAFA
jgi:dTDP-4-amino-4,6-dideoxygalactose transaminase